MDFLKLFVMSLAFTTIGSTSTSGSINLQTVTLSEPILLPVLTARRVAQSELLVCMYPGSEPRLYSEVSRTCRGGSDRCTAFVSVPASEATILTAGYDLTNPPVEATEATCDLPRFEPTGVLQSNRRLPLTPTER